MKHQVNRTPPKETYNASITDPEEVEIYELSDKEFRIILFLRILVKYKNTQTTR